MEDHFEAYFKSVSPDKTDNKKAFVVQACGGLPALKVGAPYFPAHAGSCGDRDADGALLVPKSSDSSLNGKECGDSGHGSP